MKLSAPKIAVLAAIAISILVIIFFVPINSIRAKSQVNEGVTAYKERKYDDAERYARKAVELDPNNDDAQWLLAASLHSQFRRNNLLPCYDDTKVDDTKPDGNRKRVFEALSLYKKISEKKPDDDDLYDATSGLFDALADNARQQATKAQTYMAAPATAVDKDGKAIACLTDPSKTADQNAPAEKKINWDDEAKKWNDEADKWTAELQKLIEQRAANPRVDPAKRAKIYLDLANPNIQCAKDVTDSHEDRSGKDIRHNKPQGDEDIKKYNEAIGCNEKGMQQVRQAIDLSETEHAWSQMYNLLLQASWLAEMGSDAEKKRLEEAANQAVKTSGKTFEELINQVGQKVKDLHEKANPAASPQQPQPAG